MFSCFLRSWSPRVLVPLWFILGMALVVAARPAPGPAAATAVPEPDPGLLATPPQIQQPFPIREEEPTFPITQKQKRELLKQNFKRMKRDAEELAALAKTLQEELNKSDENVLSLKIVDNAEKIERLAKRIKSTARGF
jgi:hypothetical protein